MHLCQLHFFDALDLNHARLTKDPPKQWDGERPSCRMSWSEKRIAIWKEIGARVRYVMPDRPAQLVQTARRGRADEWLQTGARPYPAHRTPSRRLFSQVVGLTGFNRGCSLHPRRDELDLPARFTPCARYLTRIKLPGYLPASSRCRVLRGGIGGQDRLLRNVSCGCTPSTVPNPAADPRAGSTRLQRRSSGIDLLTLPTSQ